MPENRAKPAILAWPRGDRETARDENIPSEFRAPRKCGILRLNSDSSGECRLGIYWGVTLKVTPSTCRAAFSMVGLVAILLARPTAGEAESYVISNSMVGGHDGDGTLTISGGAVEFDNPYGGEFHSPGSKTTFNLEDMTPVASGAMTNYGTWYVQMNCNSGNCVHNSNSTIDIDAFYISFWSEADEVSFLCTHFPKASFGGSAPPCTSSSRRNAQAQTQTSESGDQNAEAQHLANQLNGAQAQAQPDPSQEQDSQAQQLAGQLDDTEAQNQQAQQLADQLGARPPCPDSWSQPYQTQAENLQAVVNYVADITSLQLINNSTKDTYVITSVLLNGCYGTQELFLGGCLAGGVAAADSGYRVGPKLSIATNPLAGPGSPNANGCYPVAGYFFTVKAKNLNKGTTVTLTGPVRWQPM